MLLHACSHCTELLGRAAFRFVYKNISTKIFVIKTGSSSKTRLSRIPILLSPKQHKLDIRYYVGFASSSRHICKLSSISRKVWIRLMVLSSLVFLFSAVKTLSTLHYIHICRYLQIYIYGYGLTISFLNDLMLSASIIADCSLLPLLSSLSK